MTQTIKEELEIVEYNSLYETSLYKTLQNCMNHNRMTNSNRIIEEIIKELCRLSNDVKHTTDIMIDHIEKIEKEVMIDSEELYEKFPKVKDMVDQITVMKKVFLNKENNLQNN